MHFVSNKAFPEIKKKFESNIVNKDKQRNEGLNFNKKIMNKIH
jgi:hypothetical protein